MLADYLQRNAERAGGLDEADDAGDAGAQTGQGRRSMVRGGRQAGQNRKTRLPTSLTLEEKFRIANQEVDALNKDIEQTKRTSEQNLDILKALMEETDIRTAEVKRDAYEFRRDIVVGAENPRTGRTMAE